MIKHFSCVISIFFTLLAFGGCKETVTSSGASGNIEGFIQLYNSDNYNDLSDDNSGATISLPGTGISTTSERSGKWVLSNVPPGIYKIFFTKAGYTSWEDFNIQFTGNGTYYYAYSKNSVVDGLYPLPNLFPDIVLRPFSDSVDIHYTTTTDSLGHEYVQYDTTILKNEVAIFSSRSQSAYQSSNVETVVFFGKKSAIDPSDPMTFQYSSDFFYNHQWPDSSGIANINIIRSQLLKAGFTPGETVYCAAFATIDFLIGRGSWFDPEVNRTMYAVFSPNHSEIRSFVLP